jgi:hypothetical protein
VSSRAAKSRAKKPRPEAGQVCVQCTKRQADTADHSPPASWFPDNLQHLQRITVPCCSPCNKRLEKAEREFLLVVGMAIPPEDPVFKDVSERLQRSFHAPAGKSRADSIARWKRALEIKARLRFLRPPPGGFTVPARTPAGLLVPAAPALEMAPEIRKIIGEKFARALHWERTGELLPSDTRFEASFGSNIAALGSQVLHIFGRTPTIDRLAPVLQYRFNEDGNGKGWFFRLWLKVDLLVLAVLPAVASAPPDAILPTPPAENSSA